MFGVFNPFCFERCNFFDQVRCFFFEITNSVVVFLVAMETSKKLTSAYSEGSNQSAHPLSLIRVIVHRILKWHISEMCRMI